MALGHLLQNLDEETDLDLGSLLQQSIQRCSPFRFAEDTEPLFNGTELILEILIQGGSRHLLESRLILIDVCQPLLSRTVDGIIVALALVLLIVVDLRRRANTAGGERGGESRHICGCS